MSDPGGASDSPARSGTWADAPHRNDPLAYGVSQLSGESLELALLVRLQGAVDELRFDLAQAVPDPFGSVLPCRRHPDEAPAPVVGVGAAGDELLLLQPVEHHRDVVRPDREDLCELARLLRLRM